MNDKQMQEIKRRRAALSLADWEVVDDYSDADYVVAANNRYTWIAELHNDIDGDKGAYAKFIAAAPADIDTLIAEVERLQAQIGAQP